MNQSINGHVIVAVVIIGSAGVVNAWKNNKPAYRIIIGAGILLIVLSIMDMLGGTASTLASALSMIAVVYVLLNVFPWSVVFNMLGVKPPKGVQ